MPIFRVKSVKIYTGQKKFTRVYPWLPWQIWGMIKMVIKSQKTGGWFDEEWPVMSNQRCLTLQAPPVWSSSEQSEISCSPQPYHKVMLLVLPSSARKGSKTQNLFISRVLLLSRPKVLVSQRLLTLGIWEYIDQTLYYIAQIIFN